MLMLGELYDALKNAGTREDLARHASEAVAGYAKEIAELKGDVKLIKWMLGFNLAMTVALFFQNI